LSGGEGQDVLNGDAGDDTLGLRVISSLTGNDAERGNDRFDGGPGNDTLESGRGPTGNASDSDVLVGGDGIDTVTYDRRTKGVTVAPDGVADDGVTGERDDVRADVEHIVGGRSDDTITGGDGPETLDGGPGSDKISGGGGDDQVDGGVRDSGNDELSGGDGNDTITGEAGDDVATGDAGNDKVNGGDGVDTEDGGAGNDVVTGGAGSDERVAGGAGNDTVDGSAPGVVGTDGGDLVTGGPGEDSLNGGDGNDRLDGGAGSDVLSGGAGKDEALYSSARGGVSVTLDGRRNDGVPAEGDNVRADIEDVQGGSVGDTVTGNGVQNALGGGAGEDYIDGEGGHDRLSGGAAGDVLDARDGVADHVDCGRGTDLAILDPRDRTGPGCDLRDTSATHTPRRNRLVLDPLHRGELFGLGGMHRTVPLRETLGLPFGSRADVTRGAVRVLTAIGRRARQKESAVLSRGAFLVKRPHSGPALTELHLTGGNLAKCRSDSSAGRALLTRAHGPFRVYGRFSSATGRGHSWLVEDRCEGTYTRAMGGPVTVRDFGNGRTITLKNGEHYLARRGNR
jgi:hypothetical protein